jgi:hypothetical protein
MDKLAQVVTQIAGFIPQYEINNSLVSKASVGWHIAHSCLVINSIVGALKKSNPADYRWKFSMSYLYVTIRGGFPRGRGKAPERVMPLGEINPETLRDLVSKSQNALAELPGLPKNVHFKHPFFGMLNRNATIRFLEIHTNHHVKIMKDIIG